MENLLSEVTTERPGGGSSTFTTHPPTATTIISFRACRGSKCEETEHLHVITYIYALYVNASFFSQVFFFFFFRLT